MGLSQKCFCRCMTKDDRRGKFCKDFRSMPPKKLDAWENAILFPTSEKKIVPECLGGKRNITTMLESIHNDIFGESCKKKK